MGHGGVPGLTDFSCLEKQVEHEHLSGCLLAKLGLKDAIYDIFTKYESFKRRIGGASGYCIVSCSCQHVWGVDCAVGAIALLGFLFEHLGSPLARRGCDD